MEQLTIYLDRVFAGGEIRDSQNVVVYRMESAYDPLAARRGAPACRASGRRKG